ncbi:hypothetical protein [Daejeonella oryzae]|uniref:hypothetical protein n=1 Tax=Daejeonella oryzae TaxID=1122943 RepID=UPI00047B1CEC|nr:hypothetical protein [Daejeonella oryzae]
MSIVAVRFSIMILFSLFLFILVIRIILKKHEFVQKQYLIYILSIIVVVFGMLFGKYGANAGLKWWIYYPVPMLINVFLPPVVLKMNLRNSLFYLLLSFLSAPFIHLFFSFFFNWNEYMPFWKVEYIWNYFG